MSVTTGVINSFLDFLKSLSNPKLKSSISFLEVSSLNTIKAILNELPLLNDLYNNGSNPKRCKFTYIFFS